MAFGSMLSLGMQQNEDGAAVLCVASICIASSCVLPVFV